MKALIRFQLNLTTFLGQMAAWLVDHDLKDTAELTGRAASRGDNLLKRFAPNIHDLSGYGYEQLCQAEVEDMKWSRQLADIGEHRLRLAACRLPARGAVLVCLRCGGYSQSRVDLLGKPCRGWRRSPPAARRRVEQFYRVTTRSTQKSVWGGLGHLPWQWLLGFSPEE